MARKNLFSTAATEQLTAVNQAVPAHELPRSERASFAARGALGAVTRTMSVTGEYTVYFGGTKALALAAINNTMTRVNGVFEKEFSMHENLVATANNRSQASDPWTLEKVYALFPRLKERERNLGANLSGGEQQMLAIGRALMTNPRLLILDEATEGLAPLIRLEIWDCLTRLKASGEAILVIDKNVDALARFADRHVILEKGRVVWTGTSAELTADPVLKDRYLHV